MPKKKPTLVWIDWHDQASDWPWFWLIGMRDEWLHLRGADYPDGSAKHEGDCFWVHKSEVRTMRTINRSSRRSALTRLLADYFNGE